MHPLGYKGVPLKGYCLSDSFSTFFSESLEGMRAKKNCCPMQDYLDVWREKKLHHPIDIYIYIFLRNNLVEKGVAF